MNYELHYEAMQAAGQDREDEQVVLGLGDRLGYRRDDGSWAEGGLLIVTNRQLMFARMLLEQHPELYRVVEG